MLDIDDTSDAAHQARRARRRDEDNDQESFANVVPKPEESAPRADPHPAPRHVKAGARHPQNIEPFPSNRKHFSVRPLVRRRRRMGVQKAARNSSSVVQARQSSRRNGQSRA
jgi:hypothetical protein